LKTRCDRYSGTALQQAIQYLTPSLVLELAQRTLFVQLQIPGRTSPAKSSGCDSAGVGSDAGTDWFRSERLNSSCPATSEWLRLVIEMRAPTTMKPPTPSTRTCSTARRPRAWTGSTPSHRVPQRSQLHESAFYGRRAIPPLANKLTSVTARDTAASVASWVDSTELGEPG
jgi:hypothetical protein